MMSSNSFVGFLETSPKWRALPNRDVRTRDETAIHPHEVEQVPAFINDGDGWIHAVALGEGNRKPRRPSSRPSIVSE